LKMSEDEPNGATQSGRRYLSASGDPTEVSEECLDHLQTCEALTVSDGLWPTLTCTFPSLRATASAYTPSSARLGVCSVA
jgi:hypothetical protein